jgi:hypothetical protein
MDRPVESFSQISQTQRDLWRSGVLPVLALGSLSGLIGVYWDISWHIDIGRDTFFSPPHNFIYLSMLIALLISVYGLITDRRASPLHVCLGRAHLHPGLLIVAVGAALELFFAPADELWHRMFGADVTLWAPMHLIGVSGLILYTFGGLVSSQVEWRLTADPRRKHLFDYSSLLFAALLLGWSMLLLAEYEFGVPAFPIYWHPLLLSSLPIFTLVLIADLKPLPFAATMTALLFTIIRLLLAGWLTVTASLNLAGITQPVIPILIGTALAVDLLRQKKVPLWCKSLLFGVTGFLSNYLLSLFIPIYNWHSAALMTALPAGLILGVLLSYLATLTAQALKPKAG